MTLYCLDLDASFGALVSIPTSWIGGSSLVPWRLRQMYQGYDSAWTALECDVWCEQYQMYGTDISF
jgi:hypothetical protein